MCRNGRVSVPRHFRNKERFCALNKLLYTETLNPYRYLTFSRYNIPSIYRYLLTAIYTRLEDQQCRLVFVSHNVYHQILQIL